MSTSPTPPTSPRGNLIVSDNSQIAYLMDTGRFEHCFRIAKLMASASLIPDHLKIDSKSKQPLPPETIAANCFMIVNQAFRWEFDPFNVAPETYVVGGKLAFQGKLVAAAINARAGLEERLSYEFEGKPGTDDFTVIVSGRLKGEVKPRTVRVSVGQAKTDNQMWKKDPEQKLIYTGAVKWARRHTPEIILGVLIEDEADPDQIRTTTGRVIGEETHDPYADPRLATDQPSPATTPEAAPRRRGASRTAPASTEPATDPNPPDAPETSAPPLTREQMVTDFKDTWRKLAITQATAVARYRNAGVMGDISLVDMTDEQLAELHAVRESALADGYKGGAQ